MTVKGWKDGVVTTDEGDVIIAPGLLIEDVKETSARSVSGSGGVESVYHTLRLGPLRISGNECVVTDYFVHNRLEKGVIVLTDVACLQRGFPPAVNKYSDRPGEVAFLQSWVLHEAQQSPPAQFVWGEIGAVFDDRGGFSCIFFRLK